MKRYSRLELLIVSAAMELDKYAYEYSPYDYQDNIGYEEICRVRHVNDLIQAISNNSNEFLGIIKQLNEDIEFLCFELKESGNPEYATQLRDAYKILQLLNQIA